MFSLFRAIIDRLKAMFATNAAMEFEAEMLAQDAERRAELLRRADRYAQEGLHGIAEQLRRRAEELHLERPLASVLPALAHLQDHSQSPMQLPAPHAEEDHAPKKLGTKASRKKGR
jgi:hypothetical protein